MLNSFVKKIIFGLAVFSIGLSGFPVRSQEAAVTLKLGTLAPQGSPWDKIIRDMGESWKSAGVLLKVYPDGELGDEPDIVTKMRTGQIQVAVLTVVGLSQIDKGFSALSVPMLYKNDAESDFVRSKLQPILAKRLLADGFKILNWGDAGWVMFFGKDPILTPDDLKKAKFFIWGNDTDTMNIWKSAGYSPIPLAATDILPNLQTGLINSFDATPLSALSFQWFPMALNMTNLKWAPLVGATIITTKAWNSIPAASKPAVLAAAAVAGKRFKTEIRSANQAAIDAMKQRGLIVHDLTSAQYAQWEQLFQSVYPEISGTVVPADMMKLAIKYRDEFRAHEKASAE
ncbi:MAG: TRAP transporter substrate-binding protein DctP [bacterium]